MEIRGSILSELEYYVPSQATKVEKPNIEIVNDKEKIKELDSAVNKLNEMLKYEETYAEYNIHEKLGDIMIKIISVNTKEVLMEIPPQKILDLVAKLCENAGLAIDKKV